MLLLIVLIAHLDSHFLAFVFQCARDKQNETKSNPDQYDTIAKRLLLTCLSNKPRPIPRAHEHPQRLVQDLAPRVPVPVLDTALHQAAE